MCLGIWRGRKRGEFFFCHWNFLMKFLEPHWLNEQWNCFTFPSSMKPQCLSFVLKHQLLLFLWQSICLSHYTITPCFIGRASFVLSKSFYSKASKQGWDAIVLILLKGQFPTLYNQEANLLLSFCSWHPSVCLIKAEDLYCYSLSKLQSFPISL